MGESRKAATALLLGSLRSSPRRRGALQRPSSGLPTTSYNHAVAFLSVAAVRGKNSEITIMDAEEIQRSLDARRCARHSIAMEGLHETPEEAALLDAVARGEIDGDEYRRRVLADLEREIQERDRRRLIPR